MQLDYVLPKGLFLAISPRKSLICGPHQSLVLRCQRTAYLQVAQWHGLGLGPTPKIPAAQATKALVENDYVALFIAIDRGEN
jgi:hypothetical protein